MELHFNEGHLSGESRDLLRDRFGDRLFLYPDDGMHHRRLWSEAD
jgi:hypothetical protein